MVRNPLGADQEVSVAVGADTGGFTSAIDDAIGVTGGLSSKLATLSGVLVGGAAIVGIGVVAAMAKATQAASEFETAMADVEKVTSAEVAAGLQDDIMALSEEIPVARSELTKLAEQAGKFGVEGEQAIAGFVETAGQMATAMDLPADELGRRMAKIAQATDTPISKIDKLGNAVNSLADSMKTDADEITNTAQRAGIALSDRLGLGTDQVLALSAAMNEVSPTARRAAGSLRKMAATLMDPGKVEDIAAALGMTPEAFRQLREQNPQELLERVATSLGEGNEQSRALASALGKRGVESFSRFGNAISSTDKALATVNGQFEDATSLEREMSIRTDTLQGQQQLLADTVNNVATNIGQALLPAAKSSVSALREGVQASSDFVAGVGEMGQVQTLLDKYEQRWSKFGDTVSQALSGDVVGAIRSYVDNSIEGFKSAVPVIFGEGANGGGVIDTALAELTDWLKTDGVELTEEAWGAFGSVVRGALIEVRNLLSGGRSSLIGQGIDAAVRYLRNDAPGDLRMAAGIAFDALVAGVSSYLGELTGRGSDASIEASLSTIATYLRTEGPPLLKSAAEQAWGAITSSARSAVNDLISGGGSIIKSGWGDVTAYLSGPARQDVKRAFETIGTNIRTVVTGTMDALTPPDGIVANAIGDIATYVRSGQGKEDVEAGFKTLLSNGVTAAELALEALTPPDGIVVSTVSDVSTYLSSESGAISDVKNAVETLIDLAILAPFEGLYDGLVGNSVLKDELNEVATWLETGATSTMRSATETLVDKGIIEPFDGVSLSVDWPSPPGWLQSAMDEAGGGLQAALDYISNQSSGSSGGGGGGGGDAEVPDGFTGGEVPGSGGSDSSGSSGGGGGGGGGSPIAQLDTGGFVGASDALVAHSGEYAQLDTGGFVGASGALVAHSGEYVVPEAQISSRGDLDVDMTDDVRAGVADPVNEQTQALAQRLDQAVRLLDTVATEMQGLRRAAGTDPGRYDSL